MTVNHRLKLLTLHFFNIILSPKLLIMQKGNAVMYGKIIGTGSYTPARVIDNTELTNYIETSDEWIKERTGVARRHVMENESTSDMAVKAAARAIENAGINPEEIDMIIVSSVSSDLILPNTACFVQSKVGAVNATCFDMNSACTGFMMAYNTVQGYINAGMIDTALIIGAEGLSRIVNWEDRGTCILFGDGAGAAVIRKDETAVFETVMGADGNEGDALTCESSYASRARKIDADDEAMTNNDTDKQYVGMDGQRVFRFAVKTVPSCIKELMEKMNITTDDIDLFILHQANKRIVEAIAKRIGAPIEKVPMNMMEYGNTSSACIPILLDELNNAGMLKSGQRIIMSGFGAGLTWAATYMEL